MEWTCTLTHPQVSQIPQDQPQLATTNLLGFTNIAVPLPTQCVRDGTAFQQGKPGTETLGEHRNKATCRGDLRNKLGADVIKRRKTYFGVLLSVWATREILTFGTNITQPGIKEANLQSLKKPLSGHTQPR